MESEMLLVSDKRLMEGVSEGHFVLAFSHARTLRWAASKSRQRSRQSCFDLID